MNAFLVPTFYANTTIQALIEIRPDNHDPELFWRQLRQQGITHLLLSTGPAGEPTNPLNRLSATLLEQGCADVIFRLPVTTLAS